MIDEEYYINKIKLAMHYSPDEAHIKADEVLCKLLVNLGFEKVVAAWNEVEKWYD